jgi:beta-lactamase regulating signal transducer with metallopeptidase domain
MTADVLMSFGWPQRLAGSLPHFLWQGAVLALLAALLFRFMERRSAESRYAVAVAMLGLMLVAPCLTLVFYAETGALTSQVFEFFGRAPGLAAAASANVGTWTTWIVSIWAAGVAVCGIRLMAGWILSRRLIRLSQTDIPDHVVRIMERARQALLGTRPVRLLLGGRDTPMVFGWLRPIILLPATAVTGLTEAQLLAVFAHELAHIRRHDFLINALQRGVESRPVGHDLHRYAA